MMVGGVHSVKDSALQSSAKRKRLARRLPLKGATQKEPQKSCRYRGTSVEVEYNIHSNIVLYLF